MTLRLDQLAPEVADLIARNRAARIVARHAYRQGERHGYRHGYGDGRGDDADRLDLDPVKETVGEAERARRFLLDLLDAGPRTVADVREAAEAERLSWRTVERAKRAAGVRSAKTAGPWTWTLAGQGRQGHQKRPARTLE
jgi:hypothetical protein